MGTFLQDVKQAIRGMRKSPMATSIAVLSIALGIGAATAIFTAVNAMLLRAVPFEDPDRLVMVWEQSPSRNIPQRPVRVANFVDWKQRTNVFEDIAMSQGDKPYFMTGSGEPQAVNGYRFSWNMFNVLRAKPLIGRTFTADEDRPGFDQEVILSYRFWQERFNGDKNVLGKSITLSGRPYTIIGVMPDEFRHPNFAKIWTPLALPPTAQSDRNRAILRLVGRLREGVTIAEAERQLNGVANQLAVEHPDTNKDWLVKIMSMQQTATGDIRPVLVTLFAAVALLLLIACTNVANLLMTKATERRREFSLRVALGATRARLIQQTLTESVVLSSMGGVGGLLLAIAGTRILVRMFPKNLPNLNVPAIESLPIDTTVLVFCFAATLFTGVLFGLLPALQSSGNDVLSGLHESSTSFTASKRGRNARSLLVITEIGLALVLLTGAGLALKSYQRLAITNLGFDPDHVFSFYVFMPQHKYPDYNSRRIYQQKLLESLSTVHGVSSLGSVSYLPLSTFNASVGFALEGQPVASGEELISGLQFASPGYFQTMRIPLLAGRDFSASDIPTSPEVAIVSRAFVNKFFKGADPIGHQLNLGNAKKHEWAQIIGVVGDVKENGADTEIEPELYVAHAQNPNNAMAFTLRTQGPPESVLPEVRQAVWAVDKDQPIERAFSMEEAAAESLAIRKITTGIMTIFGSLSVTLACIGIYGVIAFSVVQRTHEFGIRMALGETPGSVLRLVLTHALKLGAVGITIGLIASIALSKFASTIVYGVSTRDPFTLISTSLLLGSIAVVASLIPALRASRLDPMVALREE